jgi:hypothetical protein
MAKNGARGVAAGMNLRLEGDHSVTTFGKPCETNVPPIKQLFDGRRYASETKSGWSSADKVAYRGLT